ncbi:hypothetical protein [Kitasatospora sp. NPDC094011]|uniref:hypothetical protein n=1 Tax=Kitasatospora sp. NPDC094011 TaxID=3364090 RepID=UPI0037FC5BDE
MGGVLLLLGELEERPDRANTARTYRELDALVTDLGRRPEDEAGTAEPGCPTVTVVGHPGSGQIKIKQNRR